MQNKKYLSIFNELKIKILDEVLKDRIPSIRNLCKEYSVNKITIIKALEKLKSDGFIYSLPNSGFYVQKHNRFSIGKKNKEFLIDFSNGLPNKEIFPVRDYKECILKVLDRDGASVFDYEEEFGYIPLRQEISNRLKKLEITANWENIFIIPGSQTGIEYISRILLDASDYVVIEDPTYTGALNSFLSRGAKIISVSIEKDGIDLDMLEEIVKKNKIKLLYTVPNFQNPTGISMSTTKMKKLIKLAEKYKFYILEDDTMSELNFSKRKIRTLKSFDTYDRVIYIKSFSKIFNPGFKMGYLIINNELKNSLTQILKNDLLLNSALNQRAFHYFLTSKKWDRHLLKMKKNFKTNYLKMKEKLMELDELEIEIDPKGGLYFWIKLKKIESFLLYTKLLKHEIGIVPGNMYADKYIHHIRISFAKVNENEIEEGFKIISKYLK